MPDHLNRILHLHITLFSLPPHLLVTDGSEGDSDGLLIRLQHLSKLRPVFSKYLYIPFRIIIILVSLIYSDINFRTKVLPSYSFHVHRRIYSMGK